MTQSPDHWLPDHRQPDQHVSDQPRRDEQRHEPLEGVVHERRGAPHNVDPRALDSLAWLLDDMIRIPGLNVRFGLDGLIGLVPGVGDVAGTALGSLILVGSVRYRVPLRVLAQMAWNLFVDQILGLLPVVGDAADALHRANRKNYNLLQRSITRGETVDTDTRGYLLRAGAMVAAIVVALVAVTGFTLWALWQGLSVLLGVG